MKIKKVVAKLKSMVFVRIFATREQKLQTVEEEKSVDSGGSKICGQWIPSPAANHVKIPGSRLCVRCISLTQCMTQNFITF